MKNLIRLYFVLLFLSACEESTPLLFSSEEFTEASLDICKTDACSSVTVDYVVVSGDPIISEKINTTIDNYIIKALFLGEDNQPTATTLEAAAKDFILAYRDHQPDMPTDLDFGGYEAEVNIYKSFENEELISLHANFYLFTGGAHGYGGASFLTFDAKTGDQLQPIDLIHNITDFTIFVESKFRSEHQIGANESINATGFWFENDTFSLPDTIGFEKNKMVFIYNAYEIASYADGPIMLEIPLTEVQPFFDATFL